MFHQGSAQMAHQLDRFGRGLPFEHLATEAARLEVGTETIRRYLDWYGDEPIVARMRGSQVIMPAYEFYIRRDITGTLH